MVIDPAAFSSRGFLEAIQSAISKIDFNDDRYFSLNHRRFYDLGRQYGLHEVWSDLSAFTSKNMHIACFSLASHFGEVVLAHIEKEKLAFFPFHDFQLLFEGNSLCLRLRALGSVKLPKRGWAYQSPQKPRVRVRGSVKQLVFSKHAIERICERLDPCWRNYYTNLGDVCGFFYECTYFEPCLLNDGRPAITFFESCFLEHDHPELTSFTSEYYHRIAPPGSVHGEDKWYYRVGYCPLKAHGNYANAATFLFPGYVVTPEHRAIEAGVSDRREREELLRKAKVQNGGYLRKTGDLSLIRRFHDLGVPQLVLIRGDVFAHTVTGEVRIKPERVG